jgi:hypothetical protein
MYAPMMIQAMATEQIRQHHAAAAAAGRAPPIRRARRRARQRASFVPRSVTSRGAQPSVS